MKRILLVRHTEEPGDDHAETTLKANGHAVTTVMPFKGEPIDLDAVDGAVIYGGPFNVFDTDKHTFLHDEARLIGHCLDNGLPLLGICQGAQQIAWHLGANVGPVESGIREFGYFEIAPTDDAGDFLDRPLFLPQNHFHTFDLPVGAVHLASSEIFPNQAFRIGDTIYGLQFHAEQGPAGFRRWQDRQGAPYGTPGAQERGEQDRLMQAHHSAQFAWFSGFVSKLFG
ncbi:glutamine amidotransferase [Mesorhizobium sp. CU2]|uniref:type 1 glutamine amidotransferase n=1 Tax=unclassified Mesorhizobium TaxID=325217 RepID=UPI001128E066|nr:MULTISPECIES: glutamine amidotransferase [unclassified Mesorhizobium]TPN76028.1 glutamine amidotransferase [Mesorhizobium sp. CU3]TPO14377.1 glutamine amidotransferase [Mesorhizobium sp. CU2]